MYVKLVFKYLNIRNLNETTEALQFFIPSVRKVIFSIKVFITLLDYLKIPQVAILGDLHV
jgi:hypothetical protein